MFSSIVKYSKAANVILSRYISPCAVRYCVSDLKNNKKSPRKGACVPSHRNEFGGSECGPFITVTFSGPSQGVVVLSLITVTAILPTGLTGFFLLLPRDRGISLHALISCIFDTFPSPRSHS